MNTATRAAMPDAQLQSGSTSENPGKKELDPGLSKDRLLQVSYWLGIALASFLAAFVMQFFFPLREPVYSPAYTAGGNNRAGAIGVALVACLSVVGCLRWKFGLLTQTSIRKSQPISKRSLYLAISAVTVNAAFLGALIVRGNYYYADAGYFLTQLRSGMIFHGHLYRDVEFAYGPFLYFWPAAFVKALGPLGISMNVAYVLSLLVLEAAGTALLFYTVNALPLTRRTKVAAFIFFVIITLDPQEGLNYTAFRFIMPALGVVILCKQRSPGVASLVAALCAAAGFAVSPELGVAFSAAAFALSLYWAFLQGWRWAGIAVASLISGVFCLWILGPAYLGTLREFAKGGYNMILEPAPHIYLLLLCAVAMAPMVLADAFRMDSMRLHEEPTRWRETGMLIGLFIAGLALLPAALGRCDPLHVAYNGWPLYLLSFVALDRLSRHWKIAGVSIAMIFAMYSVLQEYALGSKELRGLLMHRAEPYSGADLPNLERAVRGGRVALPFYKSLRVMDGLIAAGEYQPTYLCIPGVDATADHRTIADMRSAQFVAVPIDLHAVSQNPINNSGMKFRFRLGYRYKQRRAPYYQNLAAVQELQAHWHSIGLFGSYQVFAKNGSP